MAMQLIKRNKIVHVGFQAKVDEEVKTYSICNRRWDINDKTWIGQKNEITCKRCLKKLEKVDSEGYIIL